MAPRGLLNAYIDESGDDGWQNLGGRGRGEEGASSEWLVLAGVLIAAEDDADRTRVIDRLRAEVGPKAVPGRPLKPLHWRQLRADHVKKKRAVAILADEPLEMCIVALWKPALADAAPGLRKKGYLYNYATRFLVERLSWFATRKRRDVTLCFENRAMTKYGEMQHYIRAVSAQPGSSIERHHLRDVRTVNSASRGAQLADYYASAIGEALEPDRFGAREASYLFALRHQLFRRRGRSITDDGFKLFPREAADQLPWLSDL